MAWAETLVFARRTSKSLPFRRDYNWTQSAVLPLVQSSKAVPILHIGDGQRAGG